MRAINHAITGATLSIAFTQPWLGLPLAFISHFGLDAIPHHDSNQSHGDPAFAKILIIDFLLCVGLVVELVIGFPGQWFVPVLGAFLATSPDLMWLPGYWRELHGAKQGTKFSNPIIRFHSWIQWYQKPDGIYVETAWFGMMSLILAYLLSTAG